MCDENALNCLEKKLSDCRILLYDVQSFVRFGALGLVVTLKEINGVNRIDDFIQNCQLRGWLVNKIDIENRIDIYNIAEEDIHFEE